MNAEDRTLICMKFEELRKVMLWQTVVLVGIAVAVGVPLAPAAI